MLSTVDPSGDLTIAKEELVDVLQAVDLTEQEVRFNFLLFYV